MSEEAAVVAFGKTGQRLNTVLTALKQRRNLVAVYHSAATQESGKEARQRTLVPLDVYKLEGGDRGEEMWYLNAFDSIRGINVQFRLDRFEKLQLAGEMKPVEAVYPAHFNVRKADRKPASGAYAEKLIASGYWAAEPVTEVIVDRRLS